MSTSNTDGTRRRRAGTAIAVAAIALLTLSVAVGVAPAGASTGTADLGVTLTGSPNVLQPAGTATYVATVVNNGPDAATHAVLIDPFQGVQLASNGLSASSTAGSCSINPNYDNGFITCQLGTLAASASATVTIVAKSINSEGSGTVANTVYVASDDTDPVSTNNSAMVTLVALPPPSSEVQVTTGLYGVLLRRKPTAAELTSGAAIIDGGGNASSNGLMALVDSLLATTTYRGIWVSQQIERYLGRPAGTGAGYYVKWLAEGRTYDQVVASLVSSAEFIDRAEDCPAGAIGCAVVPRDRWIQQAYRAVTGTTIPAAVLAGDDARVAGGATPYQIVSSMVTSAAGRVAYVRSIYQQFLKRAPSSYEDFVYTSELLKQQITPIGLEASVIASPAYFEQFIEDNEYGGLP